MLNIQIDASSLEKAKKSLAKKGQNVAGVIQTILNKSAVIAERYGKIYSPVKTGRMRSSIALININESSATVSPQVFYAKYVERRIPFMYAAQQSALPDIKRITDEEIKKALE